PGQVQAHALSRLLQVEVEPRESFRQGSLTRLARANEPDRRELPEPLPHQPGYETASHILKFRNGFLFFKGGRPGARVVRDAPQTSLELRERPWSVPRKTSNAVLVALSRAPRGVSAGLET